MSSCKGYIVGKKRGRKGFQLNVKEHELGVLRTINQERPVLIHALSRKRNHSLCMIYLSGDTWHFLGIDYS